MLLWVFIALILQVVAGILLLLSYNSVLRGKNFVGIAATGCVFGIIGSFMIGMFLFSYSKIVIIPILNWLMLVIYIVVLVVTAVWRKE